MSVKILADEKDYRSVLLTAQDVPEIAETLKLIDVPEGWAVVSWMHTPQLLEDGTYQHLIRIDMMRRSAIPWVDDPERPAE